MFEFIVSTYHTLLYQPIFNTLVVLYNLVPGQDFGVAVILLTLLFRFALYPLSAKAIVAQKKLTELQPKVKELQEKHKDNKDKQAREMLELYKREKINPFASIAPIFLQLPVLIALYQVFWRGLAPDQLHFLYSFVANPTVIDPSFLGLMDLGEKSFFMAGLAGVFQFIQGKQVAGKAASASPMQKQMVYFFPVLTLVIVSQLPSAIGLYWIVTSLFSIGQQWYIEKAQNPKSKIQNQ